MKKIFVLVFLSVAVPGLCQPLRDINYEYLYNPDAPVLLHLKPVRGANVFTIVYHLQVSDTSGLKDTWSIAWEGRQMLGDKEGTPLTLADVTESRATNGLHGSGTVPVAGHPRYLVGRVINKTLGRAWLFYTRLEPDYPVNNFLVQNGAPVLRPFIRSGQSARLGIPSSRSIVSYYDRSFPAAAPAFSEGQARVSVVMDVDSVFQVPSNESLTFTMEGLYLVQTDTTAVEGLAFRVEDDYPQFTKLTSLPGPLIYITTRQEYERLRNTNGNKKAFDRIILGIAADTERARILMRNYFRRVELANRYFTSYKEGWKTDRGMVYIIFGPPDQVLRFEDREVWNYNNDRFAIRFNFSKASSLFDPDNYVLIRDKQYERTWYEVIDLWRNARF